jgi:hypothetical protein
VWEPRRAVGMIKHGLSIDADDDGPEIRTAAHRSMGWGAADGGTIAAGSFSSSIENFRIEGIAVLGWVVPITEYDVQCLKSSLQETTLPRLQVGGPPAGAMVAQPRSESGGAARWPDKRRHDMLVEMGEFESCVVNSVAMGRG